MGWNEKLIWMGGWMDRLVWAYVDRSREGGWVVLVEKVIKEIEHTQVPSSLRDSVAIK